MRRLWAGSLVLTLTGWVGLTPAQDLRWQPAPASPAPAVTLGPPVALGRPVPARATRPVARGQSPDDGVRLAPWSATPPQSDDLGGVVPVIPPLQLPPPATPVSARIEYPPPYTPPQTPVADAPGSPLPLPPPPPPPSDPLAAPGSYRRPSREKRSWRVRPSYSGEPTEGQAQGFFNFDCFQSDRCFDNFISPVSNPFLFEDPRSLTEARLIFLYQSIPNSNWVFQGGEAFFFGSQFRLALCESWSLVIHKLGGVSFNPGDTSLLPDAGGFAEFWLGPKWTFLRNKDTGTVAAAGVNFQIPTGPSKVFQDTGDLSVVPYFSIAQNFGHSSYGSFNVLDTLGYAIRADGERSDYFFNSLHLDYDCGNRHKFYPLVELNWFHYTSSGSARPIDFEGADLANFGATDVNGRNNLTLATGFRYRFSECVQTGLAVEFPLVGTRDIFDFRLGIDLIFRY